MREIPQVSKVRRQVTGADEHAVHPFDPRDRLEVAQSDARLDLDEHTDLLLAAGVVIPHPPESRRACGRRETPDAARRIPRGGDGLPRLGLVLYVGHEESLHAGVEEPLDAHRIVPRRADDGMRRAAGGGLQLAQHHRELIWRMLAIEEQPVEAGPCQHLDGDVARETGPEPDLELPGLDRAFEVIEWQIHVCVDCSIPVQQQREIP